MRKKLSLILVLLLIVGLAPKANASNSPFSDVPVSHWAYHEIMEAYNDGVMTGTAPGVFSPNAILNMAQFVTILTRAFYNEDVLNSPLFGDWPSRNYDAAEKHKLFTGLIRWGTEVEVTREVMAQMMFNVMTDQCLMMSDGAAAKGRIPDFASVGENYRDAVAVCYEMGLLAGADGQGNFNPKGNLDRAQTAVIYTRLKKAINGLPVDPEAVIRKNTRYLTNGMPVTEENVLALIEEYRNGKEPSEKAKWAGFTSFQDLEHYDPYNPPFTIMNSPFGGGTECAKLAFAFLEELFGKDISMHKVTDPQDVRPGDLIEFDSHWCVAISSPFPSKFHPCCIYSIDGGATGLIDWGSEDHYWPLSFDGGLVAIYSCYPE